MGAAETVTIVTIEEVARDAMADAHGDVNRAATFVIDRVDGDMSLLHAMVVAYLRLRYPERLERKHVREAIRSAIDRPIDNDQRGHRVFELAKSNLQMLMSFPLVGGKPIGEATKGEIRASAEALYAKGSTMVKEGKWQALVAGAMKDEKRKCKELLKEEDLKKLRTKVSSGN